MSAKTEQSTKKTSNNQKYNTSNAEMSCLGGALKMISFTALLATLFILYFQYFGIILDKVLKLIYKNYNRENIKSWNNPKMSGSTRSLEFSYICLILSSVMHIVCSGRFRSSNASNNNNNNNNNAKNSAKSTSKLQQLFKRLRKLDCCKYIPTYFGISLLVTNLYSNYTHLNNLQELDLQLNTKLDIARTNHINYLNKMEAASFGMMLMDLKIKNYTFTGNNAHNDENVKNIKMDPFQLYNSFAAAECNMNNKAERLSKDTDLENQLEFQQYNALLKGLENLEYYKQNCRDQCFLSLVVLAGYGTIQGLCYILQDQEPEETSTTNDNGGDSNNDNGDCKCGTKNVYSSDFATTQTDEESDLEIEYCSDKDMEAGFA
ncbi:hypothetical protein ACO0QE_001001 [Hanseniaspora vineae]